MHGPVWMPALRRAAASPRGWRARLRGEHRPQRAMPGGGRRPSRRPRSSSRARRPRRRSPIAQDVEVAHDRTVRGRVPDLAVEPGRVPQVGEGDGQAAGRRICSPGRSASTRRGRGTPGAPSPPPQWPPGRSRPSAPRAELRPLARIRQLDPRRCFLRVTTRPGTPRPARTNPVAARFERHAERAGLAGARSCWATMCGVTPGPPTQYATSYLAHGRARPEDQLDRPLEVGLDVDVAARAVTVRSTCESERADAVAPRHSGQRSSQRDSSRPHRVAGRQSSRTAAALLLPGVGERIRAQTGDVRSSAPATVVRAARRACGSAPSSTSSARATTSARALPGGAARLARAAPALTIQRPLPVVPRNACSMRAARDAADRTGITARPSEVEASRDLVDETGCRRLGRHSSTRATTISSGPRGSGGRRRSAPGEPTRTAPPRIRSRRPSATRRSRRSRPLRGERLDPGARRSRS